MLQTGRRFEDGFEVNIEEIILVYAVVPERKFKQAITGNSGGDMWLDEV